MSDIPVEKRFAILCQITRAQHFAFREAVAEMAPEVDTAAVVDRMWEITGKQTAAAYAKRLDTSKPVARQVADGIAWSSQCMGEDAEVEETEGGEVFLRHSDCPWVHWHRRMGLESECRPGCDTWFRSTMAHLNAELGTKVNFETIESLPEGEDACLRRLWVED